jgi:hypothetical protein
MGTIDLTRVRIVPCDRDFLFCLENSEKKWFFGAKNAIEKKEWENAILTALKSLEKLEDFCLI